MEDIDIVDPAFSLEAFSPLIEESVSAAAEHILAPAEEAMGQVTSSLLADGSAAVIGGSTLGGGGVEGTSFSAWWVLGILAFLSGLLFLFLRKKAASSSSSSSGTLLDDLPETCDTATGICRRE